MLISGEPMRGRLARVRRRRRSPRPFSTLPAPRLVFFRVARRSSGVIDATSTVDARMIASPSVICRHLISTEAPSGHLGSRQCVPPAKILMFLNVVSRATTQISHPSDSTASVTSLQYSTQSLFYGEACSS